MAERKRKKKKIKNNNNDKIQEPQTSHETENNVWQTNILEKSSNKRAFVSSRNMNVEVSNIPRYLSIKPKRSPIVQIDAQSLTINNQIYNDNFEVYCDIMN